MPRQARKRSKTGIYHIMVRGINRQVMFEDDKDYVKFLDIIHKIKEKSGFKIYGYCLMGNHIHFCCTKARNQYLYQYKEYV